MGVQWCYSIAFWAIIGVLMLECLPVYAEKYPESGFDACHIQGCKCTEAAAKMWKIINCTFNSTQTIDFTPGSIPVNTMELSIVGGKEVVFQSYSFNSLRGLQLIRIDAVAHLTMHQITFVNISSASLFIQIQGCDYYNVETNAFKNMQASVSIEVKHCSHVSIKNSAFSHLLSGEFYNIPHLELVEGAFKIENLGVVGHHGPVTTLLFNNVFIPKIPKDAFRSALDKIIIKNSEVKEVYSEAFKTSQISVVLVNNSSIHRIQSGAFSDGTLVIDFKLSKCRVHVLETRAVMASMTNLTIEHSKIREIHKGAINSTVARATITDNEITNIHSQGLVFKEWNYINIDNNILKYVPSAFLDFPYNPDTNQIEFSFVGNEIYKIDSGALNFIPTMELTVMYLKFSNNFFNHTCHCDIDQWLIDLLGNAVQDVNYVLNSSYCTVNALLSRCFELREGLINMYNFTQLVCSSGEPIKCEPYVGDTKVLANPEIFEEDDKDTNSNLILGLVLGAVLIVAVSGTIVILLIRGGLWLKRKGYCLRFHNFHYNAESINTGDEGRIPVIINNKLDVVPEELTPEILQRLRDQLEDPTLHDDACEMIERLYELFIAGDGYANNNKQDEETHLYEELGIKQSTNIEPKEKKYDKINCGETFGFLKIMEEKCNTAGIFKDTPRNSIQGAGLILEYSEPNDAAVHLYSELTQNKNGNLSGSSKRNSSSDSNNGTQRSNNSGKMAFRPLPEKPNSGDNILDSIAGPSKSTKF